MRGREGGREGGGGEGGDAIGKGIDMYAPTNMAAFLPTW